MNFKKNGGFTLVELIVVIAILGLLAGIGVPMYSQYVEKAQIAVDNQNLNMLHNVFVVSCVEHSVDPANVSISKIIWDGTTFGGLDTVAVSGEASAAYYFRRSGGETPTSTKIVDSFNGYIGTEGIQFKSKEITEADIIKGIEEGVETGSTGGTVSGAYDKIASDTAFMNSIQTQINSVKGSAFAAIGSENLLGQVTDVASLAADLIYNRGDGSKLTGVVMSDEYINTMAGMLEKEPAALKAELETMFAKDPQAFADYMANSTVLNVANTMNSMSAEQEAATKQNLATLNFGNLGTTLQESPEEGLAQAALLYGMYTAFDPDGAKNMVSSQAGVNDLINLGTKTKTNADGTTITFAEYIAQVNTAGSDAAKDYEGYKSALDIVNQSTTKDKNVANQALTNGYSDKELSNLMKEILGS